MNTKLLPHFLIIGAPKCGTTALHHYLSQHPEVNMSPKEIHYFGKDLGYKVDRPSLEEYQSHFKETGINGDGSVWYLYSDSIYEELKSHGIQPKLIILLRDPVQVAYALHSQNIVDANENVQDFKTALDLESVRITGNQLPPDVDPPRTVYYKETADFYPRVKLAFENNPKENIFIGLQKELQNNTIEFLSEIEKFLGISSYKDYNLERINVNKTVKNKSVHQLIKKPGNLKRNIFRAIVPSKRLRKKLVHRVYSSNLEKSKRKPLDANIKKELNEYFKPGVSNLQDLIDRDISSWLKE